MMRDEAFGNQAVVLFLEKTFERVEVVADIIRDLCRIGAMFTRMRQSCILSVCLGKHGQVMAGFFSHTQQGLPNPPRLA
jgi:hypothetical protein